ncbi:hypothetical protein CALCODRAFT_436846 [Calocera cornea HHB12733]|uniref:Uncharacterized protein n=1 Tax=Calocera cornea HHB12733 TaxID=1353952 RepID=A0A165EX22_9BASI|nr:hypothetical protein CALCODRAFT_436846 [Calocera cornea HHB12733]
MISKTKLHAALHLTDDVMLFGPCLLYMTERYESYNSVFRLCSVLSNRHAPSKDIGKAMAQQARSQHITSGGYWQDKSTKQWVCASDRVLKAVRSDPMMLRLLGQHPEVDEIGRKPSFRRIRQ